MKLTADTITDEQILELRLEIERVTAAALGEDGLPDNHLLRRRARARCAEILNARAKQRCPGRAHRNHAEVTCNESCCANCGGPVDEDMECRC